MASAMKVAELKKELQQRGLDTSGLKKDLTARLEAAMAEEAKPPETTQPGQAANQAADPTPASDETETKKKRKLEEDIVDGGEGSSVVSTGTQQGVESPGQAAAEATAAAAPAAAPAARDSAKRAQPAVTRAQWWYYFDAEGKKQGPQYPGSMREWFSQGYFDEASTLVAPSFNGEIPKKDAFRPIDQVFSAPAQESAFVAAPGIAAFPPERLPSLVYDDGEIEAKPGAKWLEDKLEDLRNGKHSLVTGRPVLKGSFVT
mmetsp:Transcript_11214/g.26351  ORF Transcript_11214/g.26351 Transcript_11214/m.26351 type:complete len:259 (+) Transcript_11214:68-844(+)